jgi:hypothetical protein
LRNQIGGEFKLRTARAAGKLVDGFDIARVDGVFDPIILRREREVVVGAIAEPAKGRARVDFIDPEALRNVVKVVAVARSETLQ